MSRPEACPLCGCDRGGTEGGCLQLEQALRETQGGCLQLESILLAGKRELQIVTEERDGHHARWRREAARNDETVARLARERDAALEKLRLAAEALGEALLP